MDPAPTKVELKSLSITPGEQCDRGWNATEAMVVCRQLGLPYSNAQPVQVLCLDQDWGRYGLMVYAVLDQKTIWQNAVTVVWELMIVAIGKTLVSFV